MHCLRTVSLLIASLIIDCLQFNGDEKLKQFVWDLISIPNPPGGDGSSKTNTDDEGGRRKKKGGLPIV